MLLFDFLYELVGEDELIQVWNCDERKYIYEGDCGVIDKFFKERNCRYYRNYAVTSLTVFSQNDRIGLCISINKRR